MSNGFADAQEVIQPSPTPVTWLVSAANFPDPLKGTTTRLVAIDGFHQLGFIRAFMEPDAALALCAIIEAAAKMQKAGGIAVVDGPAAGQVNANMNRAQRREAERNGRH